MSIAVRARRTRQRDAISKAFLEEGRPLSAEEVLAIAQRYAEHLAIATVYRTIHSLVREQWLKAVEVPGLSSRYEVAGKPHHHHFQCRSCGRVYDIEGCCVPDRVPVPRGFTCAGHEYFAFGTCPLCRVR